MSTRAERASGTFTPNQQLPIHRWFRYSAGFSARWVEDEVRGARASHTRLTVFDPFAGCGTTLIAAQHAGAHAVGLEAHPLVYRLARAKLDWTSSPAALARSARRVARAAARPTRPAFFPELLSRLYPPRTLATLASLRRALDDHADPATPEGRLVWLAALAVLRPCSPAGTAPWQYVLPRKRKARVAEPLAEFERQVARQLEDMTAAQAVHPRPPRASIRQEDARRCSAVETSSVDLVLTSPPYPNNYDYADATRLELSFLGEVDSWAGLHHVARRHLVRSCSQHSAKEGLVLDALLESDAVAPIRAELSEVCGRLAELRLVRAGKKTYDTMIAAYFADMAEVWRSVARVLRPAGRACFVIGDSAPYGVHVPVEAWFAQLATAHGLEALPFEQTRRRNVKWRNRKHRVPLHEGRLWVRKP